MPPEPAAPFPATARADLNRALDSLSFNVTTPFSGQMGRMTDPGVIAAGVAMSRRPRRRPAPTPTPTPTAEPAPPESGDTLPSVTKYQLAEINRRLANIGAGLDAVDSEMAEAIDAHLNEIGLADLRQNEKE